MKRVLFNENGDGVKQVNHYYPFGMSFDSNYGDDTKYQYNGKELQADLGLGWYDYGASFYGAALA